jgi:isoamylase
MTGSNASLTRRPEWATLQEHYQKIKEVHLRLHGAGIAVVLDGVVNHTAEENERGPTYAFRGIDNTIYYLVDPDTGAYRDYTSCGNTLNCNRPGCGS